MQRYLRQKGTTSGLVIAIVLLLGVGTASWISIARLVKSNQWVNHTYQVLEEINRISQGLKDAERGRRGYVLTSDSSFLETYQTGVRQTQQELQKLQRLTADNARQQQRIQNLQVLLTQRLASLKKSVELQQQNPENRAVQSAITEQDQQLQPQLEAILLAIEVEERWLLDRRSVAVADNVRRTVIFMILGYAFSFSLLLGIYRLLGQRLKERQQAETEVRSVTLAWENALDGISKLDERGHYLNVNTAYAELLGYQPTELIGKAWQLTVAPEDIPKVEAAYLALREKGKVEVEARGLRKNGSSFYKQVVMVGIYDSRQSFVGYYCFAKDISDRKQAEQALQQANLELQSYVKQLEQHNQEIALLSELSDILQACANAQEAYGAIATLVQPLFPNTSGGIFLLNASNNLVEAVVSWGEAMASQALFTPYECWALRRGQPHFVAPSHAGLKCHHLQSFDRASLCVPMMAQGETLGLLYLSFPALEQLITTRQHLAVTVAEHIGLALANLKLREKLQTQSIRDPLTGLFNRRYMEESLDREIYRANRQQQPLSVIMIDVDHFKRFNDTFGHEAGDSVLRELGVFLKKSTRGADIACRYGGEEMTLILPETTLETAQQRAEQLREGAKHLSVQHRRQSLGAITLSLGVASFPAHGMTGEEVVQAADAALYQAKAQGRDRVIAALTV